MPYHNASPFSLVHHESSYASPLHRGLLGVVCPLLTSSTAIHYVDLKHAQRRRMRVYAARLSPKSRKLFSVTRATSL